MVLKSPITTFYKKFFQLNCGLLNATIDCVVVHLVSTIWSYSVGIAPYFMVVSDTHYTSLNQTTVDSLPLCGTVIAPLLNAIVMLDRVCQPHTASQYLYIYQAQPVAMQIFEVKIKIIPQNGKHSIHCFLT